LRPYLLDIRNTQHLILRKQSKELSALYASEKVYLKSLKISLDQVSIDPVLIKNLKEITFHEVTEDCHFFIGSLMPDKITLIKSCVILPPQRLLRAASSLKSFRVKGPLFYKHSAGAKERLKFGPATLLSCLGKDCPLETLEVDLGEDFCNPTLPEYFKVL